MRRGRERIARYSVRSWSFGAVFVPGEPFDSPAAVGDHRLYGAKRERPYCRNLTGLSEEEVYLIEVMNREVNEDSASFGIILKPCRSIRLVTESGCTSRHYCSELALSDVEAKSPIAIEKSDYLRNHEDLTAAGSFVLEGEAVTHRQRAWLLTQDILTGTQCAHGQLAMSARWGTNRHHIDVGVI